MADPNIKIDITADASSVTAETQKAKAALDEMGKSAATAGKKTDTALATTGKTAAKAAPKIKAVAGATKELKQQAGETASVMGKLKSAVGLVSPEAEGLLDVMQRAADGVEGLTQGSGILGSTLTTTVLPALAALAVATAIAGTAYVVLQNESERTADGLAKTGDEIKRLDDVLSDQGKELAKLSDSWKTYLDDLEAGERRLKVLRGEIDQATADLETETKGVKDATEAQIRLTAERAESGRQREEEGKKAAKQAKDTADALQAEIDANGGLANASEAGRRVLFNLRLEEEAAKDAVVELSAARAELFTVAEEATAARETGIAQAKEEIELTEEAKEGTEDNTEATRDATRANEELNRSLAKLNEDFLSLDEEGFETAFRKRIDALDELEQKLQAQGRLEVEDIQKIAALRLEALDILDQARDAEGEKQAERDEQELEQLQERHDRAFEMLERQQQKELKAEERHQTEIRRAREQTVNDSIDVADRLLAHLLENQETETKEGRDRAEKLFNIRKALALVQIAIDTARAVTAMLAIGPAGIPLAIAAGAAGVVSAGIVASETFNPDGGGGGGGAGAAAGAVSQGTPSRPSTSLEAAGGGDSTGGGSSVAGAQKVEIAAFSENVQDALEALVIAGNPYAAARIAHTSNALSRADDKSNGTGTRRSRRRAGSSTSRPGSR